MYLYHTYVAKAAEYRPLQALAGKLPLDLSLDGLPGLSLSPNKKEVIPACINLGPRYLSYDIPDKLPTC